ncbi:MAG TPA: ABC transporter ATP-binding protein [Thermoanaerobaculia bacterium]|nr:ABC transporter ATP-binding protein [Thermoanaerobaculia bacterium]
MVSTPDRTAIPSIRFDGATKTYGRKTALACLTLDVPTGTVFALVGPNGAGKTTAIGLLTGLLAPTAGRMFVCGIDVARDPVAAKARLGFVPDRPYLWPKWTPRETLRFVGAAFGGRGAQLERRIDAELDAFDVAEVSSERNETLSHGTRQRVALAQAFLHDPSVLVLDEPMVGLDPLAQRRLSERLRAHAAGGAAVLLTTHQLALAEEIATTAGLLVEGRLVACGSPRNLETASGRGGALSDVFFDLARGPQKP